MKKVLILHYGLNTQSLDLCFRAMNWQTEALNICNGMEKASKKYDAFLVCADNLNFDVTLGIVRYLKESFNTAVVVLSEEFDVRYQAKLVTLNTDMYLNKPIDMKNVCKYVAFASVKYNLSESKVIKYKDLVLDLSKRTVCRGEKCIELRKKEFELLRYLLENSGMVLSKTKILEAVWDMNALTNTTTVESHVSTLRRKLDRDFEERLLHTVHCVGYKIE